MRVIVSSTNKPRPHLQQRLVHFCCDAHYCFAYYPWPSTQQFAYPKSLQYCHKDNHKSKCITGRIEVNIVTKTITNQNVLLAELRSIL